MSKKKKDWKMERDRLHSVGLEERRKEYRGNYVPLEKIPTWRQDKSRVEGEDEEEQQEVSVFLSDKVSLYKGDITILEVDAIVNAANSSLLGGGGVDGCIHKAAGPCLYEECHTLNGCETGKAKITCGYELPAKHVIHTVGPVARGHVGEWETRDLTACYQNSLQLVKENSLSSVAFPCISTGIYGFPNEPAADIALKTTKNWLMANRDKIDRIIFCVFLETDFQIYKEKMTEIFSEDSNVCEEVIQEKKEDDGEDQAEASVTQPEKQEEESSQEAEQWKEMNEGNESGSVTGEADLEPVGMNKNDNTTPNEAAAQRRDSSSAEAQLTEVSPGHTEADPEEDNTESMGDVASVEEMEVNESTAVLRSDTTGSEDHVSLPEPEITETSGAQSKDGKVKQEEPENE